MKLLAPITAIIAAASAGRIYGGSSSAAGYASQSALINAELAPSTYTGQSAEGYVSSAQLYQPSLEYQQNGLSDKEREAVYAIRPAEYEAGYSSRPAGHESSYSIRAEENEAKYSGRPENESTYSIRAEENEAKYSGKPAENESTIRVEENEAKYSGRPEEYESTYQNRAEVNEAVYSTRHSKKEKPARILSSKLETNGHAYKVAFETENGIKSHEAGDASGHGTTSHGAYSYTGDDGHVYTVTYTADEHGFHPQGAHLPTPPPIPEEIQKSMANNARDEANGIYDDGQYKKRSGHGSTRGRQGSQQYEASYESYQNENRESSGYQAYSGNQEYSGQQESAYQKVSGLQSLGQASGADLAYNAYAREQH